MGYDSIAANMVTAAGMCTQHCKTLLPSVMLP